VGSLGCVISGYGGEFRARSISTYTGRGGDFVSGGDKSLKEGKSTSGGAAEIASTGRTLRTTKKYRTVGSCTSTPNNEQRE
jgi:hypothetical protein